jgi:hypothetical protein
VRRRRLPGGSSRLPKAIKLLLKILVSILAVPVVLMASAVLLSRARLHEFHSYCDPIQVGRPVKGFLVQAANSGFYNYDWMQGDQVRGGGYFNKLSAREIETRESRIIASGHGEISAMKVLFVFSRAFCRIGFKNGLITSKRISYLD